jgi:uncharacterized protein (TIGR03000 family)
MMEDAPVLPPAEGSSASRLGKGLLSVTVPEDAKVFVNGRLTKTPGALRRYVSPGLVRGLSYTYEVRAEVEREGKKLSDTKMVSLRSGQRADVAFLFQTEAPVQTVLTLNLPEDATVTLAGRATRATGPVRSFATKKLAPGQRWKDYHVVVSLERNGRLVTRQETITLTGGEDQELTFGFVDERLALR